jgi:hypothetical protein
VVRSSSVTVPLSNAADGALGLRTACSNYPCNRPPGPPQRSGMIWVIIGHSFSGCSSGQRAMAGYLAGTEYARPCQGNDFADRIWRISLRYGDNVVVAPAAWPDISERRRLRILKFAEDTRGGDFVSMLPAKISLTSRRWPPGRSPAGFPPRRSRCRSSHRSAEPGKHPRMRWSQRWTQISHRAENSEC